METLRAALPTLLEEIQKIQTHTTADVKTGKHDSEKDQHSPPEAYRDPVVIDKAVSGPSSLVRYVLTN